MWISAFCCAKRWANYKIYVTNYVNWCKLLTVCYKTAKQAHFITIVLEVRNEVSNKK
jgi:hypothetical protein